MCPTQIIAFVTVFCFVLLPAEGVRKFVESLGSKIICRILFAAGNSNGTNRDDNTIEHKKYSAASD